MMRESPPFVADFSPMEPPNPSSALQDSSSHHYAFCWHITLKRPRIHAAQLQEERGDCLYFTNHDEPLYFRQAWYESLSGYDPSTLTEQVGLGVDYMDMYGLLSHHAITEIDLQRGVYDGADVQIWWVHSLTPDDHPRLIRRGVLGQVSWCHTHYRAELRSLSHYTHAAIGQIYSPTCRACFGDGACKVALQDWSYEGTLSQVDAHRQRFYDPGREEARGYFTYGSLRMLSGQTAGYAMEIQHSEPGWFSTVLPLPVGPAVGDRYCLIVGCDKTAKMCSSRFHNIVNFRGEPHVPGTHPMLQTAVK